jgi:hypothetical protein
LTNGQSTPLRKVQQLPHIVFFYYGGTNDLATNPECRQGFGITTFVICNNFKEFKALQAYEPITI